MYQDSSSSSSDEDTTKNTSNNSDSEIKDADYEVVDDKNEQEFILGYNKIAFYGQGNYI